MTPGNQAPQDQPANAFKRFAFWSVTLLILTAASLAIFWGWEFRGSLGFVVALLLALGSVFFAYVALTIAFFAVVLSLRPIGELRFRWIMQSKDRFQHWRSLAKEVQGMKGTIIIDNPTIGGRLSRAWWTGEDVLTEAPSPKWVSKYDFSNRLGPHPFEKWCFDNYTSPDTGRAILFGVWNGGRRAKRLAQRLGPTVQVVETWSASLQFFRVGAGKDTHDGGNADGPAPKNT